MEQINQSRANGFDVKIPVAITYNWGTLYTDIQFHVNPASAAAKKALIRNKKLYQGGRSETPSSFLLDISSISLKYKLYEIFEINYFSHYICADAKFEFLQLM